MPRDERDSAAILQCGGQRVARALHALKARYRSKERRRVEWLGAHAPPGSTILDIGASFGVFTKSFARLHGGACSVHAFEPVPYSHGILEAVAGGLPNVFIHKLALSDRAGEADVYIPIKASGRIGPGLAHLGPELARPYIRETVRTERLDSVIDRLGLGNISLIKCDVEGAELLVLRGAEYCLQRFRPVIYAEVNEGYMHRLGTTPEALFHHLGERGYSARQTLQMNGRFKATAVFGYAGPGDYLFLP